MKFIKQILILMFLFLVVSCGCNIEHKLTKNSAVYLAVEDGSIDNNSNNVELKPLVILKFTSPVVDYSKLNQSVSFYTMVNGNKTPVNFNVLPIGTDNTRFVLILPSYLAVNSQYKIDVLNVLTNKGNASGNFVFSTGLNAVGNPHVALINPGNQDINVNRLPIISFVFNELVTNVTNSTVILHENNESGDVINTSLPIRGAGNIFSLIPNHTLKSNTPYYVEFTNGITNLNNESLNRVVYSFTTGESSYLSVRLISPLNYSNNISLGTTFKLLFNESALNVNESNVKLKNNLGKELQLSPISVNNQIYSFKALPNLESNLQYTLSLTDGITNLSNNKLIPVNYYFTSGSMLSPKLLKVSPSGNNVNIAPQIQLTFNTQMQGVNIQNIILFESTSSGIMVPITLITESNNTIFTFNTNNLLKQFTTYTISTN